MDYRAKTGRGAEGTIDSHDCFVGNHRFAHELGVCSPDLAVLGYTSLWLAVLADTGATLLVIANALRLLRPSSQSV